MSYPHARPYKDLSKSNRRCCLCGAELTGGQDVMYLVIARGRYLCHGCEEERENIRKYGVKDADLIERIKKYSMDYEGENT